MPIKLIYTLPIYCIRAAALLVLASCKSAPTIDLAPQVCAVTAIEDINNGNVNRVATGWKTGPIVGGSFRGLQEATVGGSSLDNFVDVAEVTLPTPGHTAFRLLAHRTLQSATSSGGWIGIPAPTRAPTSARWTRVSAAHVGPQLAGCYLIKDGRAFLAQRADRTQWSVGDIELWEEEPGPLPPLVDPNAPKIPGAGRVGPLADISCAGAEVGIQTNTPPNELHVCALATDGRIWHTIFNGSTWTTFGDVQAQTSNNGPADAVACAVEGRQLHLVAVVRRSGAWFVEHTIRSPAGAWRAWDSLMLDSSGAPWPSGSFEPVLDVSANFCEASGPMPTGPREFKRLNVAWITESNVSIVERSRGVVEWLPGRLSSVSPTLSLSSSGNNAKLRTISIAEMPFPP
jgi:hypothetical protein